MTATPGVLARAVRDGGRFADRAAVGAGRLTAIAWRPVARGLAAAAAGLWLPIWAPIGRALAPLTKWLRPWGPVVAVGLVLFGDVGLHALGTFGIVESAEDLLSRGAGMLYGPIYGRGDRPGQKAIVIVALDDAFLSQTGGVWPIPYANMADLVTQVGKAGPKAIFLDSYYLSPHRTPDGATDTDGLNKLTAAIDFARSQGAKVVTGPVAASQPDLKPLAARVQQAGLASTDKRLFAYSLEDADRRPMAAAKLYELSADRPQRLDMESLAIDWGFGASGWMGDLLDRRDLPCVAATPWARFGSLMALTWRGLLPNLHHDGGRARGLEVDCPYFDIVSATWVPREPVQDRLARKIVMIGSTVSWLRDQAPTPLLGEVPGVMVHAMALDNLIQHNAGATRYPVEQPRLMKLDNSEFVRLGLLVGGFAATWFVRHAQELPPQTRLSGGWKFFIWILVAVAGVAISLACHWPLFKLLLAAITGGICTEAWDRLAENRHRHHAEALEAS